MKTQPVRVPAGATVCVQQDGSLSGASGREEREEREDPEEEEGEVVVLERDELAASVIDRETNN